MLPWRDRRARFFSLSALLVALLGCRSRSEFLRGSELYSAGSYREAYRQFWDAYRVNPCPAYWEALSAAGRRVAELERRQGFEAEAAADWATAREGYALALEYDPSSVDLRDDYLRVEDLLAEKARLLSELEACRREGASAPPWKEAEIIELLAASGHSWPLQKTELSGAIRESAGVLLRPLRLMTFEAPLPSGEDALLEQARGWRAFFLDCQLKMLEEESWLFSGAPLRREAASWGLFRELLKEPAEEACMTLRMIELAFQGVERYLDGASLEKKGDFVGALKAYREASFLHPFHAGAREGHRRVLKRLTEEAYQASLVSVRQKEWREAIDHLERLLRLSPGHLEGVQLRRLAGDELSGRHALEAYRYEEAGLPANALLRYYLALDLKPNDHFLNEAVLRL